MKVCFGYKSLPALLLGPALCFAGSGPVPTANPKVVGQSAPNVLIPQLGAQAVVQGSTPLENPSTLTGSYGYDSDGPYVPAPGDVQAPGHNVEAKKTEPDQNTYLILPGLRGADPKYDYGTHFLFQGHESGTEDASGEQQGYLTRINLDADGPHRVTLLAEQDFNGNQLPVMDGSYWYPFSGRLLFTSEENGTGGVWQATPNYPSSVQALTGILGHGAYEGIYSDPRGNIYIVEDSSGATGSVNSHAKQAASFVYRFIPNVPSDLTRGGRLQSLQVMSKAHSGAIVFHSGDPDADILSQDMKDLHTYGLTFQARWITLHDTSKDGTTPFDANALAKALYATPFKRCENAKFKPGTNFAEFYFDETGDTNSSTEAGSAYGGFGSVMKLMQSPSSDLATLKLFYLGDLEHTGFDNVAFYDQDKVVFVEDAGDSLHTQRNALDSAYLFDTRLDYSNAANVPFRIMAEGRDTSATIDSALGSVSGNGFENDGDNEITGWHESDGDASVIGLLGAKTPTPFQNGWRIFFTQQHGDNTTWEITMTGLGSPLNEVLP